MLSGTSCGCVGEVETPHAGAISLAPALHDLVAGRVGDSDLFFGEYHGTSRITEYSHAEEIVCKCRHDDTGVSTWRKMRQVDGSSSRRVKQFSVGDAYGDRTCVVGDIGHWGIWYEIVEAGSSVGDGGVDCWICGWATGRSSRK